MTCGCHEPDVFGHTGCPQAGWQTDTWKPAAAGASQWAWADREAYWRRENRYYDNPTARKETSC